MGRGKKKYDSRCIDDITLEQFFGKKGVKKIREYLLAQNAACPLKQFTNTLGTQYLTHPEGKINTKKEEPNYLVTMKGDSNTPTKIRKSFVRKIKGGNSIAELLCYSYGNNETQRNNDQKNNKSNEQSPSCKKKKIQVHVAKCSRAIGKIIHSDTRVQTDEHHQKKNKNIGMFRLNNANTQTKIKHTKPETKSCPYIGQELNKLKNMQRRKGNVQTHQCNRLLGKGRRRRRAVRLWSRETNDHNKVDPIKIKSKTQISESKLKESSKCPKEIPKECKVKHKNVCAKGLCAEAYESKSLMDAKKLKSLMTCLYKHSKKTSSKKKPKIHEPVCDPEACEKNFKVTKLDKEDNQTKTKECRKGKVKHKNICFRGICAKAYDSKSLIDLKKLKSLMKCKCNSSKKTSSKKQQTIPVCYSKTCERVTKHDKKNNRTETSAKHKRIFTKGNGSEVYERNSLIDVKKLISVLKCVCNHSKQTLTKIMTIHETMCDPEACKMHYKVTKQTSKKEHKTLPKKTEICERFTAIPEIAGDGTGDLIIRIKKPLKVENEKLHKEKDLCFRLNTNQKNACDRTEKPIKDPGKVRNKRTTKKTEISKCIDITPKIVSDRTGDPLQIEIDGIDRCILDPEEIKHKLKSFSQVRKPACDCPSRNAGRKECEGKICQQMFKEKKTNFNCKCKHIKKVVKECTDRTCGSNVIKKRYNDCSKLCVDSTKNAEPQFEVKLDIDQMCILNSDEINSKIIEKEAEANVVCPGGSCEVACNDGSNFKCKCVQKHEDISECSEPTCVVTVSSSDTEGQVDLLYHWMTKLFSKVNRNHKRMTRNPFDTNEIRKIKSMFSFISGRLKRTSEIWDGSEATKKTGCSLSGLNTTQKYTVYNSNYHRRSGLKLPLSKSRPNSKSLRAPKTSNSISLCGCAKALKKEKKEEKKKKKKRHDQVNKTLRKKLAQRQKLEDKISAKVENQQNKEMQELKNQDEAAETSCIADFILGLFNLVQGFTACLIMVVFKTITQPRKSYWRTREWVKNPQHAWQQVLKWASYKWRVQKFYMSKSVKGSETLIMMLDEVRETPYYKAFAGKGKNERERKKIEAQSRRRQRRIRNRSIKAITGCRDVLLTTLRKKPCLWVYHIWPDIYPRFLGLRTNFIQLFQMFLFCCAVVVWTPCVLCMELCRGFICCVTCSI